MLGSVMRDLLGRRKRRGEGTHMQVGKGERVRVGDTQRRGGGGQRWAAHVLRLCLL